jgi:hypothetical protein
MRISAVERWNKKARPTVYIGRAIQSSSGEQEASHSNNGFKVQGEIQMRENTNTKYSTSFLRMVIAVVAAGVAAVPVVNAKPKPAAMTGKQSKTIILVPPTSLPALARQDGEAMLLHETGDGRTLLYLERNGGTRLAVFDVTDPSHIKGEASALLGAPGPFDFVSPLGDRAEVVRFRQGQGVAILDLSKLRVPAIKTVQGLELQVLKERLGEDGVILTNQPNQPAVQSAEDFEVVETANPQEPNRTFGVKGVHAQITNDDTATTFLLTPEGLYLIRRPAVERDHETHEFQLSHPG